MKSVPLLLSLLILAGITSCNPGQDPQKADKPKEVYTTVYRTGATPGIETFETYVAEEKEMDSSWTINCKMEKDSLARAFQKLANFRENRGRIFLQYYNDSNKVDHETSSTDGFPTFCQCLIDKDSLQVILRPIPSSWEYVNFNIALSGKTFQSTFTRHRQCIESFKTDISDANSHPDVTINCNIHDFVLSDTLTYKEGQQLNGFLTFTTNNYYSLYHSYPLDTFLPEYVKGNLHFTCKTRVRTKWD